MPMLTQQIASSPLLMQALEEVDMALQSSAPESIPRLQAYLESSTFSDPLQLLISAQKGSLFPLKVAEKSLTFNDWLLSLSDWRDTYLSPDSDRTQKDNVIYIVWESFHSSLSRQLQEAHRLRMIPDEGGILAFVAGLSRCLVLDYAFAEVLPQVEPLAVIESPTSLFDFWGTIDNLTTPEAQNALKRIVSSGHKIVYHRDTLVHVDRRTENNVFGPTIDTVLLAEVMFKCLLEVRPSEFTSCLEIGSGSGLLSATALRNNTHLKELMSVDIESTSSICTGKNCRLAAYSLNTQPTVWNLNGPFTPHLLSKRFDLCICNPPYIPLPPITKIGTINRFIDNRRATGGVELLLLLLSNVDRILTPAGTLLIITSNLALKNVRSSIHSDFGIEEAIENGFEVVFDVDSVVTDPEWLNYLETECGLIKRGDVYYHTLHPLIISRKRGY